MYGLQRCINDLFEMCLAHKILSSLQKWVFESTVVICFQSQSGLIYRVSRSNIFRVASPRMGLKKSSSIASASMS